MWPSNSSTATPSSPAATSGTPSGKQVAVPLVHGGEDVGRLLLEVGPTGEPFGPTDRRLLDTLAHHIAATARTVTLTTRLQRTLEQVITAREEERRRLRRDVPDGIGPVLATGKIQLQVARKVLRTDPDTADAILRTLADNQQTLITDIRRSSAASRPPVLDQLGLVDAVRQRAAAFTHGADDAALHVHLDAAPDIEPLPAATEVAAYRIALESLTNVTKHSGADTCHVRLWKDDALHIDIQDNGTGLPATYRAGVGLTSIRERATELGGTATITDAPPHGTHIQAVLPLPAAPTTPPRPTQTDRPSGARPGSPPDRRSPADSSAPLLRPFEDKDQTHHHAPRTIQLTPAITASTIFRPPVHSSRPSARIITQPSGPYPAHKRDRRLRRPGQPDAHHCLERTQVHHHKIGSPLTRTRRRVCRPLRDATASALPPSRRQARSRDLRQRRSGESRVGHTAGQPQPRRRKKFISNSQHGKTGKFDVRCAAHQRRRTWVTATQINSRRQASSNMDHPPRRRSRVRASRSSHQPVAQGPDRPRTLRP